VRAKGRPRESRGKAGGLRGCVGACVPAIALEDEGSPGMIGAWSKGQRAVRGCAAGTTDGTMNDDEVIATAIRILETRVREGDCLASPQAVREYLRLRIGDREREVFVVVMLDAQHRVIAVEELFAGTLTQTSVYPREVVKCVLRHNAGAVIFAHNHPSGVAEPSQADQILTQTLQRALALVDVKVLDHFIVARGAALSFAERGLL
jgi:DNA repair protein RadC